MGPRTAEFNTSKRKGHALLRLPALGSTAMI
jgi:hypothetical protein